MNQNNLNDMIKQHIIWLNSQGNIGNRLFLQNIDLSGQDISNVNFRYAKLININFSNSRLKYTDLSFSDCINCNFTNANMERAKLVGANLENSIGFIDENTYLHDNFEKTNEGYIGYKVFNLFYPSQSWVIIENSIITNNIDRDRRNSNTIGIHLGTLNWMKQYINNDKYDIWKVLIKNEWINDICVPYNTNGNIRCKKIKLLSKIKI